MIKILILLCVGLALSQSYFQSSDLTLSDTTFINQNIAVTGNGYKLTITNSTLYNTSITVNGNNGVFIGDSTILNGSTALIYNTSNINIYNIHIYPLGSETPFTIRNSSAINIYNNQLNSTSLVGGCAFDVMLSGNWYNFTMDSNNQYSQYISTSAYLCLFTRSDGDNIAVTNNIVTIQYQGTPWTLVPPSTNSMESSFPTILSNYSTNTHFMLDIGNKTVGNVNINYNMYMQNYSMASTYDGFSNISFPKDNFLHIHGYSNITNMNTISNVVNGTNPDSYPAYIRTGIMFTGGTAADLWRLLGYPMPNNYQYIARTLLSLNPLVMSFQNDIEIEPNAADEFSAWGMDLCHYKCRRNCDRCILADPNWVTKEFSLAREGACYDKSNAETLGGAALNCGHAFLYVRGPYVAKESVVFAGNNRYNNSMTIVAAVFNTSITITMGDDNYISDTYKGIVNPNKSTGDSFWASYHPIVIMTNHGGSKLSYLKFDRIRFISDYVASTANPLFMTTVLYQPLTGPNPIDIDFDDTIIISNNMEVTPVIGQSAFFTFLEISANPTFYTNSSFQNNAQIGTLHFKNMNVFDVGKFIGTGSIDTLYIDNVIFTQITNGLFTVNVSNIQMDNVDIYGSFPSLVGSILVSVTGHNVDSNSSFIKNTVVHNSTFVDGSGLTNAFKIFNFNNITMELIGSDSSHAVGIYFGGLTNLPCVRLSLAKVMNANPFIKGVVYDVKCDSPTIGCSSGDCFFNVGFTPDFCLVDLSRSVLDYYYRIIYFHSITEAFLYCGAISPVDGKRYIYIVPDIYYQTGIVIKNFNGTTAQETVFTVVNSTDSAVIVGANHIINVLTGYLDMVLNQITFFNPRGVEVYDSTKDANIINGFTDVRNLRITNCKFIGQVPLVNISIPTNYTLWQAFETSFLQHGSIHPNIRSPNTISPLTIRSIGNTTVKDVSFYGGLNYGFTETKMQAGLGINMTDVYGENLWGGSLYLVGSAELRMKTVHYRYFCAGYTTLYQNIANINLQMGSGGRVFDLDDVISDSIQDPSGNTYTPNVRLPAGNPLLDGLSNPVGFIRQVEIQGVQGSTYTRVSIRNPRFGEVDGVFPVALGELNNDRTAFALNDAGPVTIIDQRTLMRQIQISKGSGIIHGFLYDIRHGLPATDVLPLPSLYCNGICPPTSSVFCRVGVNLTNSFSDFTTINQALQNCPFSYIQLIDTLYTEDILATLANTRQPIPSSVLQIRCATTLCTIVGKHSFQSTCPSVGESLPSELLFSNIEFKHTPSSDDIILDFTGACATSKITITDSTFTVLENPGVTGVIEVSCSDCKVDTFKMDKITWNAPLVTYNYTSIRFTPESSSGNIIILSNQDFIDPTTTFAYIYYPKAFTIGPTNTIKCKYNGVACINIEGSSSVTGAHTIYNTNIIGVAGVSMSYFGILWTLDQNATISSIPSLYTNAIYGNTMNNLPYDGAIVIQNALSYYPCSVSTCSYIGTLISNNPNTRNKGIVSDWLFLDPAHTLLAISTVDTGCIRSKIGCNVYGGLFYDDTVVTLVILAAIAVVSLFLIWFFTGGKDLIWGNMYPRTTYISPEEYKKKFDDYKPIPVTGV